MNVARLLLVFSATLFVAACATSDRGRCLASHQETRPGAPVIIGGLVVPSGNYIAVEVCDQWEYPDGKPTAP